MRLAGSSDGRQKARQLRREMTPPGIALWLALRGNRLGVRFRRQYPADAYVLDFYCAPARLAVEIDGEAHSRGDRPARDAARDAWLSARGVRVVRYPAREVLENPDAVMRDIEALLIERRQHAADRSHPPPPSPPAPPPPGGGGS